jgi:mannose-6-phosphate isomerase-like protein (cupin superfamily)
MGKTVKEVQGTFATPGYTIHIPQGYVHRAGAYGVDTTFIEVQTGTSFEESDIERFEDDYGRN